MTQMGPTNGADGRSPNAYGAPGQNGQPHWDPRWSTSPNPQQPHGGYPPPTSQSSQPYPSTASQGYPPPPTNGAYPPPNGPYPPANGAYPASQPPNAYGHPHAHLPPIPHPQEPRADMMRPAYGYGPPEMYRPMPGHPMQQYATAPQPAPRQRTAIACRYCRRRKIRCSGFESSDDGRCTNCVRFSQECIFTPVSAQTQAFVPAHTVQRWGNGGAPPPLYGAYGQPLHQSHAPPPPPQGPPGQHVAQGYPLPSPTGPYPTPSASYSPGGSSYDERAVHDAPHSRKRSNLEPHTPTQPPPNPAAGASLGYAEHRGAYQSRPQEVPYPEPPNLTAGAVSPASSSTSYHPGAPQQHPYYTNPAPPQPQPPRRTSPQSSNYSYDTNRTSSSPHTGAAPSTPGSSTYPYPTAAPLNPIVRTDGRTPPPQPTSQPNGARPSMRINDLVSGDRTDDSADRNSDRNSGSGRSQNDNDMLNALNRRPM